MKNKFSTSLKNLYMAIVIFILVSVMLCMHAFAQSMYIADDNFRNISSEAISPAGSWDVNRSGGDVVYSATDGLILRDTSKIAPMTMRRDIKECSSGVVTFEGVFHLVYKVEGFTFQIGDGTSNVAKIVTGPKNLRLYTGLSSSYTDLCQYNGGIFPTGKFGVKLIFDLTAGTVSVWVDGTKYVTDAAIGSGKKLNKVIISTPKKYQTTAYVCAVKAYAGYSFNERFLTSGASGHPDTWSVLGNVQLIENDGANAPDIYSLSVDGTEGLASAMADFAEISSADAIYRNAFLVGTSTKSVFSWSTQRGEVFTITAQDGILSANGQSIGIYKNNIWYDIQLNVNKATGTAKVMVNGTDTNKTFVLSNTDICSFSAVAEGGYIVIDDILAYEMNVFEVPAITKASSDNVDVGMLRCDIWREGSHIGWDAVLPFAYEREPYMGYYDDGNILVSEWETKWLVEHGVDWQLHCWFIPKPYDGGAIKTPNNAFSLEEGYMRSKNSTKIDFAIMWENTACTNVDEDIFRNCIVPYWMEHYIKDPRYKKIEGKPFVSIYNASVFLEYVGSGNDAKAKENIDYLRSEIKKLGYSDAVIMCANLGLSDVSQLKAMGFDGIHAYNWRDNTDNPATQQEYFNRASANCDAAGIAFIPTVSGGIEETPWGRPAGKRASPTTFKTVLQYAKEKNYYNSSQYLGGDNITILDSWNEIAEGHYLQPTAQDGFGYLDAICEVTTTCGTHTDDVPDDVSKALMGTLYRQNLMPNPAGQVSVPIGSISAKQWSADSLGDFWGNKHISTLAVSDGMLKGESCDIDPAILNENLDIDLERINYLKIRIKRTCADSMIKVYYVTDVMDSDNYREVNSVYGYAGNSGKWETMYINLNHANGFDGKLKKLRIDPINSVGSFEIQEIELLKNVPSEMPVLYVDGESADGLMTIPLQIIQEKIYMDYFAVRKVFGIKTSYIAEDAKIVMVDDYNTFDFTSEGILYCNGLQIGKYTPLKTAGDTYILPIEAIAQALGYDVSFSAENGYVNLTSKRFYPDVTYNISNDLDSNGLWKYRNLAPDPECTDASKFWDHSTRYTNDTAKVEVSNEVSHSGTTSVYKDFTGKFQRMGFPADIYANDELHFSAWMKNDGTVDEGSYMCTAGEYAVYENQSKVSSNGGYLLSNTDSYFSLDVDWQYINSEVQVKNFSLTGENSVTCFGDTYELGGTRAFYITQNAAQTKRVYMDDINLRRVPSFYVYTTSVSHDDDIVGTQPVVFTFSCDIDLWTVTEDKVMINGIPCSLWGASVETVTDEITRETQVRIYIRGASENQNLEITMPYIKDAWGRDIHGTTTTNVIYSMRAAAVIVDENGNFSYDVSDAAEQNYVVFVASYNSNNIVDVMIADIANQEAVGNIKRDGADRVVFYVWQYGDKGAMKPIKKQFKYFLNSTKGGK